MEKWKHKGIVAKFLCNIFLSSGDAHKSVERVRKLIKKWEDKGYVGLYIDTTSGYLPRLMGHKKETSLTKYLKT